jgi:predicted Rossmann-fold nucleotide-binding protein
MIKQVLGKIGEEEKTPRNTHTLNELSQVYTHAQLAENNVNVPLNTKAGVLEFVNECVKNGTSPEILEEMAKIVRETQELQNKHSKKIDSLFSKKGGSMQKRKKFRTYKRKVRRS